MFQAHVAQVLLASPSDVLPERDLAEATIREWNALNSAAYGVVLLPLRWESDTLPGLAGRPQGMINDQLVDRADFLLAFLWTRFGSPTGEANSGTAEEIERVRARGGRVLLYFASRPVLPETIDTEQLAAVREFKRACQSQGLTSDYETLDQLRHRLMSDLTRHVREIAEGAPLPTDTAPPAKDDDMLSRLRDGLGSIAEQADLMWESEHDPAMPDVEAWREVGGRVHYVLMQLASQVVDHTRDGQSVLAVRLRALLVSAKALEKKQFYMDGGRSVHAFEEEIGTLISEMRSLAREDWRTLAAPPSAG